LDAIAAAGAAIGLMNMPIICRSGVNRASLECAVHASQKYLRYILRRRRP
jgi:hypothetical protein